MDEFLATLHSSLPDLIETSQLVKAGVYRTAQAAYLARLTGKCPPFIRIPNRGIVYPKIELLAYLRSRRGKACQK